MQVGDFVRDRAVGDIGWIHQIRDGFIAVWFDDGMLWMPPSALEVVNEVA